MNKMSFKELILPGIVLFAICLVTTLLLGYTNQITAPKIEALAAKNAEEAQMKVLKTASSFSEPLTVTLDGTEYIYYEGLAGDGTTAGYVFTTVTKGYGGDVKIMSGIDDKGVVVGIEILQLTETPGLGMKAYDDAFLKQFFGKKDSISVVKNTAGEKQIKAMTGATITSNAVTGAVNIALKLYDAVTGKTESSTDTSAANADEAARKQLLPQAASFDPPVKADGMQYEYYTGKNADGSVAGYIFTTESAGYRGTILVSTAVDSKGVITGVKVLSSIDDPPGIDVMKSDTFLKQYIGKSVEVKSNTNATGENTVQVITGATLFSNGVTNAVNKALELYKSLAGGTP